MRLLLVAPTAQMDIIPIGLAYVSASLKRAGHEVDCCYFDTIDGLYKRLRQRYDFVGTGGMSLHFKQIETIARVAKKSHTRLVIGGNIITCEPELMTRALEPDYAIIGEGDESVVDLLKCLQEGGDLLSVGGLAFMKEEKFVCTGGRNPPNDLDALPYPDYRGFGINDRLDSSKPSDNHLYSIFDYPRSYNLVASRSCPYMCTFCYHTGPYRQRSIDSIMAELQTVIPEYRINIVEIVDDLFSYNQQRTLEFCTRFREFTATLPWEVKWFCQMRVDRLDGKLLDTMKESGLFAVSYGFESYSPTVLKSMKKNISPEQIHYAIHATFDRQISLQGNFIFGDKAETLQTAKTTLDFWKDHADAGIGLDFVHPYPGSAIYEECLETGRIKDSLDFTRAHLFDLVNMTSLSSLDFIKLQLMVQEYSSKHGVHVLPLKSTLRSVTIKCPHCQSVITYDNFTVGPKIVLGHFRIKTVLCRNCFKKVAIESKIKSIIIEHPLLSFLAMKIYMRIRAHYHQLMGGNR
jgi:radical SAM superfamily enzyme YgiQ (UPF0313 family)